MLLAASAGHKVLGHQRLAPIAARWQAAVPRSGRCCCCWQGCRAAAVFLLLPPLRVIGRSALRSGPVTRCCCGGNAGDARLRVRSGGPRQAGDGCRRRRPAGLAALALLFPPCRQRHSRSMRRLPLPAFALYLGLSELLATPRPAWRTA
jgi:hypothetical protein